MPPHPPSYRAILLVVATVVLAGTFLFAVVAAWSVGATVVLGLGFGAIGSFIFVSTLRPRAESSAPIEPEGFPRKGPAGPSAPRRTCERCGQPVPPVVVVCPGCQFPLEGLWR